MALLYTSYETQCGSHCVWYQCCVSIEESKQKQGVVCMYDSYVLQGPRVAKVKEHSEVQALLNSKWKISFVFYAN